MFWSSLYRTIRYHMGSAAFGALIVAAVQFLQAVQQYLQHQMEQKKQMNVLMKCFCCCVACCLACIERFLKFVSKNAFIMVAIYGSSFCSGGRKAFKLILRNVLRVATVNWVGDFLLFLIKLLVVGEIVLIAIGIFDNTNQDTRFWIIPVILAAIIAFFIAALFVTVLEMIVDAILICFLEDEERSKAGDFPPYMSNSLKLAVNYKDVALSTNNDDK